MKKEKGVSSTEFMMFVSFIFLLLVLMLPLNKDITAKVVHKTATGNKVYIECIEGYKFVSQGNHILQQIYDEDKKAIRCLKEEKLISEKKS